MHQSKVLSKMIFAVESASLETFVHTCSVAMCFEMIRIRIRSQAVSANFATSVRIRNQWSKGTADELFEGKVQGFFMSGPIILGFESV